MTVYVSRFHAPRIFNYNILILSKFLKQRDCSSKAMMQPERSVRAENEADRLLSSTRLNFNVASKSSTDYDSIPSPYSKSVEFKIVISNRTHFKWCSYITALLLLLIIALTLLLRFLPHKHNRHEASNNHTVAVNQALKFFDAQKCKKIPLNSKCSDALFMHL